MTMIKTGEPIEADRSYVVAGWASVNEGVEGPAVYDLMENYITRHKVIDIPRNDTVKVIGMN